MNISEPFIRRPIATTLLTVAIALAGAVAFRLLPVSPLPQVDFPTISVQAGLPGASVPMPGFGSSDCDCAAHLFSYTDAPSIRAFRQRVKTPCFEVDCSRLASG